jgi:preprotein translocase subunit YajC
MSIGGIIGTVVEARENELVVKVDDNTRMKLARWAVRNAGEEVQSESKDESDKQ